MIIHLINNSVGHTIIQMDIWLFIILHIVYILLFLLLFLYYRRKNLRNFVPTSDTRTKFEALNEELEPFGFAYNLRQDTFYSLMNCWQRDMGYCRLYDEASAPLSMIIDCEPIHFDYDGKKWLIEFWKGQYGMTTGAEVGVYMTTDTDLDIPELFHGTFYNCVKDEDRLVMSFTLLKDSEVLFHREGLHWWLTGFKLGEYTDPKALTMEIRISFPNTIMRNAFVEALIEAGYSNEDVMVVNHSVYILFDKPHTNQPLTRTRFTEAIAQNNNKFYCKSYKYITRDYDNTLDKLEYLKVYSPFLYRRVFTMGKSRELYKDYDKIQSYFDNPSSEEMDE